VFRAVDLETKLAIRRDQPEKWWPGNKAELMAGMVLGKSAIGMGVGSAPGTGAQVRD